MIWNENSQGGCMVGWEKYFYWEFEPNEIMIFAINYLKGKEEGKFKIWTGNSSTKEFTMKYDKSIIKNQRNIFELDK
ncbi:hypothetical protein [Chryseobacterium sp.]|uniref:hypothetical protein n=1 Tax=Chryseobacterium sp. TaxID=1871047 RepID=UPI0038910779